MDYLPPVGPIGPLDSNLGNPTSTSSGAFGGEVLALQLNVDFSDAGLLVGNSGLRFGDLTLANFTALPQLNGLMVRQYLDVVNTLLGGGSGIYGISQLNPVTDELNLSFSTGHAGVFAQDHLVSDLTTTVVPEPSSLPLLLSGLGTLGLGWSRRLMRRR